MNSPQKIPHGSSPEHKLWWILRANRQQTHHHLLPGDAKFGVYHPGAFEKFEVLKKVDIFTKNGVKWI